MSRLVEVILTEVKRGVGIEKDPVRFVRQFFTKDGVLAAEYDPFDPVEQVQRETVEALETLVNENCPNHPYLGNLIEALRVELESRGRQLVKLETELEDCRLKELDLKEGLEKAQSERRSALDVVKNMTHRIDDLTATLKKKNAIIHKLKKRLDKK